MGRDYRNQFISRVPHFAARSALHVRIEQTYVIEGKLVDQEGAATGLTVGPGEFVWREAGL